MLAGIADSDRPALCRDRRREIASDLVSGALITRFRGLPRWSFSIAKSAQLVGRVVDKLRFTGASDGTYKASFQGECSETSPSTCTAETALCVFRRRHRNRGSRLIRFSARRSAYFAAAIKDDDLRAQMIGSFGRSTASSSGYGVRARLAGVGGAPHRDHHLVVGSTESASNARPRAGDARAGGAGRPVGALTGAGFGCSDLRKSRCPTNPFNWMTWSACCSRHWVFRAARTVPWVLVACRNELRRGEREP